jgi:hypothetical protein
MRPTIIISGMIAGVPYQGGAAWAVLQYMLGLQQLGIDVYLVEPVSQQQIEPWGVALERSINAAYFHTVMSGAGLLDHSALLLDGTQQTIGLPYEQVRSVANRATALINIAGMLRDDALCNPVPVRVYLDLDPVFTQLWHTVEGVDMRFAGHTHFVTIGQAIGQPGCLVPDCGLSWIPTPQPVVLSRWPVAPNHPTNTMITTVGNWRSYGAIEYQGQRFGQKAHSLREVVTLPLHTSRTFALALAIHKDEAHDLAALQTNGWHLLDPVAVVGTPGSYQQFIQSSWGEFGIAKSGYVAGQCGWFSDRSLCYLASGRPVLAQDTGFNRFFPTGTGLLAFRTLDDVLAGIEEIERDYTAHARAARDIAATYFDSDRVLPRLLQQVGVL